MVVQYHAVIAYTNRPIDRLNFIKEKRNQSETSSKLRERKKKHLKKNSAIF